jgi:F420-non-reducing hydrogenase iron-sulfur subunit
MRLQYPTNVEIIRVPCTGRVDIIHLLKTLEDGADGVYVAGCMEGDCHFISGNLKARRRVEYVQKVLEELGVEKERVAMYNLSAAQGPRFVEIAKEYVGIVKELGESPFKKPVAKAA